MGKQMVPMMSPFRNQKERKEEHGDGVDDVGDVAGVTLRSERGDWQGYRFGR